MSRHTGSAQAAVTLVTGAMGCLGSWVLYHLVRQSQRAVSFDLIDDHHRLDLLLTPEEQQAITFVRGDLTAPGMLLDAIRQHQVTNLIHLAALQVPFCRANPILGAQVNVAGTVGVFEAARQAGLKHLAYASSVAVYGPPEPEQAGKVLHDAPFHPATLYGVYKVANEATAQVYWQEHGISSTALRPYTVYGVGRDQGFTSDPTRAMLAAAAGQPFHIQFNGPCQYHFASDVALQFISAAQRPLEGAFAFNLGGEPVVSSHVVALIRSVCPDAQITHAPAGLPFPAGFDDAPLTQALGPQPVTDLTVGVRQTIDHFRSLLETGKILQE